MKALFLLIITISILHVGYAQKAPHKKANHHFEQYQYSLAASEFEEIVATNPADTSAIEKLAHCYAKLNHPDKAEQYFAIVSKKRNADPENLKAYAQTLAANGKYDASQEWYKKYLTRKHDQYVHGITSSYNSLSQFYEDSLYYTIKSAPFNSEYSDFSPAYYKDGIVFCSARNIDAKKKYTWDNTPYIDLFIMRDSLRTPMSLGKPVNTALHEGPATFSTNFDTIFFTRNNYINNKKSNSKEGVVKLKIYY